MPFANLPLRFIAKAQTQGARLSFVNSDILVRYTPYEDTKGERAEPTIGSIVRADSGCALPIDCWYVSHVGGNDNVRVLKVSFLGDALNAKLGQDVERLFSPASTDGAAHLHNAFLEQALINLQVLITPDGVTPPYYTGLQLRLAYVEV